MLMALMKLSFDEEFFLMRVLFILHISILKLFKLRSKCCGFVYLSEGGRTLKIPIRET